MLTQVLEINIKKKKERKDKGSTQNKMVQLPGTGRHHKEIKQIAEIEMERLWEDKGWRLISQQSH